MTQAPDLFSYKAMIRLLFTDADLKLLQDCSARHYDAKCRMASAAHVPGKPMGCVTDLAFNMEWHKGEPVVMTVDDIDLMCKITEWPPGARDREEETKALHSQLVSALYRVNDEWVRLNKPKDFAEDPRYERARQQITKAVTLTEGGRVVCEIYGWTPPPPCPPATADEVKRMALFDRLYKAHGSSQWEETLRQVLEEAKPLIEKPAPPDPDEIHRVLSAGGWLRVGRDGTHYMDRMGTGEVEKADAYEAQLGRQRAMAPRPEEVKP